MKVTCPKSGLSYKVSIGYGQASAEHPIFTLPINKLIPQLQVFAAGELDQDSTYLLALALLNQAPTRWYCPAVKDPEISFPIILASLERLAKAIFKLDLLDRAKIPTFVIDKSTRNLTSLPDWIVVLEELFQEQSMAAAEIRLNRSILRKEEAITRIITKGLGGINPTKQGKIASLIADWAETTGDFPTSQTLVSDSYISLSSYWKQIIVLAWTDNYLQTIGLKIPLVDIEELIEHCEDNIPHGSTHAFLLMARLRELASMVAEFTQVRSVTTSLEDMGQLVATSGPQRKDYPNPASYLKAKIAWSQSQKQDKDQEQVTEISTITTTVTNIQVNINSSPVFGGDKYEI